MGDKVAFFHVRYGTQIFYKQLCGLSLKPLVMQMHNHEINKFINIYYNLETKHQYNLSKYLEILTVGHTSNSQAYFELDSLYEN